MDYSITLRRNGTVPLVRPKPRLIRLERTGRPGLTGADGGVGPQGPPGEAVGEDKTFMQAFTNSASITLNHNLGKFPSITIIDSANDEVEGTVRHNSMNSATVTLSAATSGTVYLN